MLLEGRSRNIDARRRSPTTNVLVSDNLPVKKSYFDSNIIARILRRFFFSKDYFEADVDRSTCLYATSSKRES